MEPPTVVKEPPVRRVLYILGAGHCGSTLLSLLTNAHSQCIAVSELSKIGRARAHGDTALQSTLWRDVAACFESRTGMQFEELSLEHPHWSSLLRWGDNQVTAWAQPRAELMQCIAEISGRNWVVDASKSWQQLYLMERSGLFDLRVVHLVRDPHGIVHSYSKKYGRLRRGLSKWLRHSTASTAIGMRMDERFMRVRYEDLASDPAATLEKICGLVGIPYEPSMLQYRKATWLGLGGNRMARRTDETITIDERWKTEMRPTERVVVDVFSAAFNRLFGY